METTNRTFKKMGTGSRREQDKFDCVGIFRLGDTFTDVTLTIMFHYICMHVSYIIVCE